MIEQPTDMLRLARPTSTVLIAEDELLHVAGEVLRGERCHGIGSRLERL